MQKNPVTFDNSRKFILELEMARQGAKEIGVLQQREESDDYKIDWTRRQSAYKKLKNKGKKNETKEVAQTQDCSACGKSHAKNACPAKRQKCNKCNKLGHLQVKCWSKTSNRITVGRVCQRDSKIQLEASTEKKKVTMAWYPDTGADCDVMGLEEFKALSL